MLKRPDPFLLMRKGRVPRLAAAGSAGPAPPTLQLYTSLGESTVMLTCLLCLGLTSENYPLQDHFGS